MRRPRVGKQEYSAPARSAHPSAAFEYSGMPGSTYGYFVQFPHPGKEHHPRWKVMGWHSGLQHRRKFMISPARYRGPDGCTRAGEVVFWGEWEPPSEIIRRWAESGNLPRALHRPFWVRPTGDEFRQNTDPWVFGDRMILSNCRQVTGGRPSPVQGLTRGSVVCFGSTIGGTAFCVDTVMVIASAQTWVPGTGTDLRAGAAFQVCAAESLSCGSGRVPARLTLYRGATFDDPVNGMYSFVPARAGSLPDPRFARPAIQLDGLVVAGRQAPWRSPRSMPPDALHRIWDAIRYQVLEADLVLADRLETPPCRSEAS
jgi:hypothetical protein